MINAKLPVKYLLKILFTWVKIMIFLNLLLSFKVQEMGLINAALIIMFKNLQQEQKVLMIMDVIYLHINVVKMLANILIL